MKFVASSVRVFIVLAWLVPLAAQAEPAAATGAVQPPPAFDLRPSDRLRPELMRPAMRRRAQKAVQRRSKQSTDCHDMNVLAGYSGTALADYVANLPDSDCANSLFSLTPALAARIDSAENVKAVADRFAAEAAAYASTTSRLVNLTVFLRAAYYVSYAGTISPIPSTVLEKLGPAIMQLVTGPTLFTPNPAATSTAGEVLTLITNMRDEANYLEAAKQLVAEFTNSPSTPNAAQALNDPNVGYGFTGILKIFFYSHYRPDAIALIENDPSYATTLYGFVRANKPALSGNPESSYQLNQAATEAFRFCNASSVVADGQRAYEGRTFTFDYDGRRQAHLARSGTSRRKF
jgi:microbial collagenase